MDSNRIKICVLMVVALVSFSTQAMLQVGVRVGAALAGGALGEKACENYNEAKKVWDDPRYIYAVRFPDIYEKDMNQYQLKGSFQRPAPDYVQDLAKKYARAAGLKCYEGLLPIYVDNLEGGATGISIISIGKIFLHDHDVLIKPDSWAYKMLIEKRDRFEQEKPFILAHELIHAKQFYDLAIVAESYLVGLPLLGAMGCFSKALTGRARPLALLLLGAVGLAPLVEVGATISNVYCKGEVEADLGALKILFDLHEHDLIQKYLSDNKSLIEAYPRGQTDGYHAYNDEKYHYLSSYYQALQEKKWLVSVPYSYKLWGWQYVNEKQRKNKDAIRKELHAVDELVATHSKADLQKMYEKRCEEYSSITSEPFSWHQPSAQKKERCALAYFHLRLQGD